MTPNRHLEVTHLGVCGRWAEITPDLVPGHRYDLATIVVLMPTTLGLPPMALRMTGLPRNASAEQVETWIHCLKQVAAGI